MQSLSVTVVVPSYRRPDDLHACLEALDRQHFAPDVIAVVARPEDASTRAVADLWGAKVVPVTRPGLAAAIEVGINAADTALVAFTDDDARPHSDWLARIVATFSGNEELGFVGGRDNVRGDALAGSESLIVGAIHRGRILGNHALGKGAARNVDHVKGANMAFRVSAIRGFPLADLVAGDGAQHRNELFLCWGAATRGWVGVYDPHIQVEHLPAVRGPADDRKAVATARTALDTRNAALAALLFLPGTRRSAVVLRAVLVGERFRPGIAWAGAARLRRLEPRASLLASLRGTAQAFIDARAARRVLRESAWAGEGTKL
ncbi:glycosyltransferase family 2 protein [Demequina mangrovi]|uniref:glycosyltransferase family 2 protein n=1 Tax=Demequina mangrovi TaxID=1043493 RepID=UPI000942CE4C|nr:glycosyltransferase family 2 protein [Demequina mangrovi]